MMPLTAFLFAMVAFVSFMFGSVMGYKNCIENEKKKKGVEHYSSAPWNEHY